jgi:hypothetical protein
MNRDEAMRRDFRGLPIESARELVFVLAEVQRRRTGENTPCWYLLNRLMRVAMDVADMEERGIACGPALEDRLAALEKRVTVLESAVEERSDSSEGGER